VGHGGAVALLPRPPAATARVPLRPLGGLRWVLLPGRRADAGAGPAQRAAQPPGEIRARVRPEFLVSEAPSRGSLVAEASSRGIFGVGGPFGGVAWRRRGPPTFLLAGDRWDRGDCAGVIWRRFVGVMGVG